MPTTHRGRGVRFGDWDTTNETSDLRIHPTTQLDFTEGSELLFRGHK